MFLNIERIVKLTAGANKTESRVRIPVGSKVSDAGRSTPVYATFKIDGAPTDFAQLTALLRGMPKTASVNITLPRIVTGEAEIEIQLRPVYTASVLADILDGFDASAKEKREARAAAAKGNLPVPETTAGAPHEDTAAQRAKGSKGAAPANNGAKA